MRDIVLGATLAVALAACEGATAPALSDATFDVATRDAATSDAVRLDSSIADAHDAALEGCTGGELPCPGCERTALHVDRIAGCALESVPVACEDRSPASAPVPAGYRVCTKEEAAVAIAAADVRCGTG